MASGLDSLFVSMVMDCFDIETLAAPGNEGNAAYDAARPGHRSDSGETDGGVPRDRQEKV